jgi:transcriptional regulator with XRE-family HTH domain
MNTRRIEKIQKGFTQKQLAELLGVQQPHLSAWFNGRHLPRYETVVRLAEILNYNAEELDTYFHNVYNLRKTKNAKEMVILDIQEQLKFIDIPSNSKVVVQIHTDDNVQELSSEVNN